MTIHDELILELIKPDKSGKPTGDIIKIVGTSNIEYAVEQTSTFYEFSDKTAKITPDVVVRIGNKETAIELENDIQWDFARSLQQIIKYLTLFTDIVVNILR